MLDHAGVRLDTLERPFHRLADLVVLAGAESLPDLSNAGFLDKLTDDAGHFCALSSSERSVSSSASQLVLAVITLMVQLRSGCLD